MLSAGKTSNTKLSALNRIEHFVWRTSFPILYESSAIPRILSKSSNTFSNGGSLLLINKTTSMSESMIVVFLPILPAMQTRSISFLLDLNSSIICRDITGAITTNKTVYYICRKTYFVCANICCFRLLISWSLTQFSECFIHFNLKWIHFSLFYWNLPLNSKFICSFTTEKSYQNNWRNTWFIVRHS